MTEPHDHDDYSHFHLGLNSLLNHIVHGNQNITAEEANAMKGVQQPEVFLICCIDSRFQPDKALDYGPGVALEYRPIAAVVPPVKDADQAFLARMAFRRLKDVNNIVIIAHSDCGGAQASINVPKPDLVNGGDLDIVADETHRTGLDVTKLSQEFLKAANGDVRAAGNHLAKDVSVQSLKNLLEYKGRGKHATIADEMKSGDLHVALLFYDLEKHSVEQFDLAKGVWEPMVGFDTGAPAPKAPPPKPAPPPP
ncbi:MAG: hypothetical protein EPN97_06300 [Alphaproteobacteria bacterium]|nr:MAG: hypothetical protein EPN97_06300 [Alphaproteobacteria bacterium]